MQNVPPRLALELLLLGVVLLAPVPGAAGPSEPPLGRRLRPEVAPEPQARTEGRLGLQDMEEGRPCTAFRRFETVAALLLAQDGYAPGNPGDDALVLAVVAAGLCGDEQNQQRLVGIARGLADTYGTDVSPELFWVALPAAAADWPRPLQLGAEGPGAFLDKEPPPPDFEPLLARTLDPDCNPKLTGEAEFVHEAALRHFVHLAATRAPREQVEDAAGRLLQAEVLYFVACPLRAIDASVMAGVPSGRPQSAVYYQLYLAALARLRVTLQARERLGRRLSD